MKINYVITINKQIVIEEIEMYEVKQGPYAGEADKTRFEPHINELKFKKKTGF